MIRAIKKIIKYTFFTFVFSVVFAEVFLRIVYFEKLKTRVSPLIYQPDNALAYRYIPNVSAEINIPSIHKKFKINKNGFFGKSFEKNKRNGTYRIAVMGTSEASGIWMNSDENFCVALQKLFDKNGVNVEVLNFSMDGRVRDVYNVRIINEIVRGYKPDLVLLHADIPFIYGAYSRCNYGDYVITYNRLNEKSLEWCKAKIDYIESHKLLKYTYNLSYIARAACRYYINHYGGQYAFNLTTFVEKKIQAFDILFIPYSVKNTIEILKDTERKLKSINSDLILYYYSPNDFYKSILTSNGFKTIFLNIEDDASMMYEDDGHYNEKAQKIIANQLFKKLEKYIQSNRTPG